MRDCVTKTDITFEISFQCFNLHMHEKLFLKNLPTEINIGNIKWRTGKSGADMIFSETARRR